MANIRLVKRRIKTAKNISQITKAMELVAAAKMKKAQVSALAGKLYAEKIYEMVMRLSQHTDYRNHPLLMTPKPSGRRLVILLSTNKGLNGSLNSTLFRYMVHTFPKLEAYDCITVGKKGADFLTRIGHPVMADFSDTMPKESVVPAIVELMIQSYVQGKYDGVDILSNEFVSVVKQIPRVRTLLPLTISGKEIQHDQKEKSLDFIVEPSVHEVFTTLLPHYIENQVRDAVLQAEASEYAAQMIAMHNATDNANALQDDLTLVYNKARQEKITYEITDMTTARLAVESS